jgi:2-polyprenyl-6-methoxyphenol hydroxylase-like FAD-dependent oxidoreductase
MRDVAVAGAGPTGLAVALMLARQGKRVVVHERFDAAQPVGAGFMLQPTGLAVLDALGLTDQIEALGQPIDHIFGRAAPTGRVVLDVRYSDLKAPRLALGVHRAAIFHVLHQACLEAGVGFELGREATGASDGRLSFADGSTSPRFDLVVDATGARSPIARNHGAKRLDLEFGALWTTTPWPVDPHFDVRA